MMKLNIEYEKNNKQLTKQVETLKDKVQELHKLIKVKNQYLEAKLKQDDKAQYSTDVDISAKLATKAAGKITELRKTVDTLLKAKEKDRTYFEAQTGSYSNEVKRTQKII